MIPRLIGVIHLPALAGAPGSHGKSPHEALQQAGELAVREALILEKSGFDGLILENFGDAPFFKTQVPPETLASLSIIAGAVREVTRLPVGVNVLRNDARAALAIAAVADCAMIRVNVLTGVSATDQGMIEGCAAELLRERARLHAEIAILADVHVKHARSLSSDDIALAVEETAGRGHADAVILTGSTTGRSVDLEELERASAAAKEASVPLLIGSGAKPEQLPSLLKFAHGVIVGSSLRKNGRAGAPLDPSRCRNFARAFSKSSSKKVRPRKRS